MTRWHIQTFWLVVSLIALILAIFITCKNANENRHTINTEGNDEKDANGLIYYKDDAMDYNVDLKYKDTKDNKKITIKQKVTTSKIKFRGQNSDSDESNTREKSVTDAATRKYCVNIANTLRGKFWYSFFVYKH